MSHPFGGADAPLPGDVEVFGAVEDFGEAVEEGVFVLSVVEDDATDVDQVAVGDFVVAGGDLGAVGGDDGVVGGGGGEGDAGVEGFHWFGGGESEAIAPKLLLDDQISLVGLGLD